MEWWQVLILGLAAVATVSLVVKINLVQLLEFRQKKLTHRAMRECPHATIDRRSDGELVVDSLFQSPPGTIQWQCMRCGLITSRLVAERTRDFWVRHPDKWLEQEKRFNKIAKKL